MTPIKEEEIQPLLLAMLQRLKTYFDRHGLRFYLAGGTLLGAVRHHGFIPWDDDIDVFVRWEDFERLMTLAREDPFIDIDKRYQLLLPAEGKQIYPFFKLVDTKTVVYERNIDKKFANGLWIDIFCMSYWPDSEEASERVLKMQKKLKRYLQLSVCGNLKDLKYKVIYPFALPAKALMLLLGKNCNYWAKRMLALGEGRPTQYIGNLCWTSGIRERYPLAYYDETVKLNFEGNLYDAPAEYDAVLQQFYGDYMVLPPVEKRVRHDFDAYYVD